MEIDKALVARIRKSEFIEKIQAYDLEHDYINDNRDCPFIHIPHPPPPNIISEEDYSSLCNNLCKPFYGLSLDHMCPWFYEKSMKDLVTYLLRARTGKEGGYWR